MQIYVKKCNIQIKSDKITAIFVSGHEVIVQTTGEDEAFLSFL